MSLRPVKKLSKSKPTLEGAGVHLRRAFGFGNTCDFDPFLLLDDFRNDVPEDYLAGFPWHPHRGIETITYVLAGTVDHGDSMGNHGAIAAGDVQWMTAGKGIIHQEMPKGDQDGRMHGFQLWANLPSSLKMTAPHYQEVKAAEIPIVKDDDGTAVASSVELSGVRKGPWMGLRRSRFTWMFRYRPDAGEHSLSNRATPSLTFSPVLESSVTPPLRSRCLRKAWDGGTRHHPCRPTTARSYYLITVMRLSFRRGRMEFVFCWCPVSPSRSRSHGTGRSL